MNVPEDLTEWRREAVEAQGFGGEDARRILALIDALEAARKVLRMAEYTNSIAGVRWCPVCAWSQGNGHAPDCALAAVLRREE